MLNINIDYWLYIESYVYTETNENGVLLYNTLDGNFIESHEILIIELINSIFIKENSGVVLFNKEKFKTGLYKNFISEIRTKYIGDLIPIQISNTKPIQLIPILNLQKDVEKINQQENEFKGSGVLDYLNNISLYINNECHQNCKNCTYFFRQSNCCTKSEKYSELSISKIKDILNQCVNAPLNRINIIGGNIFKYSKINELTKLLDENKKNVSFWNHYLNCSCEEFSILESYTIEIIITFPINEDKFSRILEYSKFKKINCNFYITDLDEFEQTEFFIDKYSIEDYSIKPIYNELNYSFFCDNVFLNKEDLFSSVYDQKRIFANQKLNANFFGRLTISPNGDIKANNNTPKIGNINKNTILNSVFFELINNSAWRITRNNYKCKECLYKFLCPPPSDYEFVIGKQNLCNVNM